MFLVDVEAGDAPVRTLRRILLVLAPVLDAREFLGAAVLAPALCGAVLVENERGVSATRPDPVFLYRAIADLLLAALGVVTNAPAPAEDPVVALDKLRECSPGRGVQRSDRVIHPLRPLRAVIFPAREIDASRLWPCCGRHARPRPPQQGARQSRSG